MVRFEHISPIATRREVLLFLGFYVLSALTFYTASWVSFGAFNPGHPPYFDLVEFLAAGGAQFSICLLVTIPIWFFIFKVFKNRPISFLLFSHLFFMPLFVCCVYFGLLALKNYFGWAMIWGGYNAIWTLYILSLFYFVQFGFIHSYVYFKHFKTEQQEKAQLREAVLQSQITAMKSQLNPHFLHNLFNSINASLPPENERTRELIVQLSDLFRYQNYASQTEFVTIKEEIEFIETYLDLMKIRLKERLVFSIQVDESLHHEKIAPMLLQPLIENAVTHGIAPKIEPSELNLIIHKKNGKIHYSIEDSGLGIADEVDIFKKGLGLSNTKLRLEKMYQSKLIIEPNLPCGTKISFSI